VPLQQYLTQGARVAQSADAGARRSADSRVAAPLSPTAVSERQQQSRSDDQIVHVTIGRIDVIANAAPSTPARTAPTPRTASVSLSDYLRADTGKRR